MALKDIWIDKINGVDDVSAEDPNIIAHAVIDCENNVDELKNNEILNKQSGEILYISDSKNAPLEGLIIYGKTTQGADPTPEATQELKSVGADGDIKVNITRKNLAKLRSRKEQTVVGITTKILDDGTILINGTAQSEATNAYLTNFNAADGELILLPTGTYTFSEKIISGTAEGYYVLALRDPKTNKTTYEYFDHGQSKTLSFVKPTTVAVILQFQNGQTANNAKIGFQIEVGTVATDFEPYQDPQVMTIPTPIALNGIPVANNGNFTDASGQQWVCDYIDFEKKKKVFRVGRIESYNGEEINTPYLSNTGELNDGAIVVYVIDELIETTLTEAEIVAYKNYHTNYPNTTIYSDDGAFLNVKYKADTKHYIDNKFNSLEKAILSLGGNI